MRTQDKWKARFNRSFKERRRSEKANLSAGSRGAPREFSKVTLGKNEGSYNISFFHSVVMLEIFTLNFILAKLIS